MSFTFCSFYLAGDKQYRVQRKVERKCVSLMWSKNFTLKPVKTGRNSAQTLAVRFENISPPNEFSPCSTYFSCLGLMIWVITGFIHSYLVTFCLNSCSLFSKMLKFLNSKRFVKHFLSGIWYIYYALLEGEKLVHHL